MEVVKIINIDEFNKHQFIPIINNIITRNNNLFKVNGLHIFDIDKFICENIYDKKIYSIPKSNISKFNGEMESETKLDIIELENYEYIENKRKKINNSNINTIYPQDAFKNKLEKQIKNSIKNISDDYNNPQLRVLNLEKYFNCYMNVGEPQWFIIKNWMIYNNYQRMGIGTNQLLYLLCTLKVDFIHIHDISSNALLFWLKFVYYEFGGIYYNKPLQIGGCTDIQISYPTLHYLIKNNENEKKINFYKCLYIEKNI